MSTNVEHLSTMKAGLNYDRKILNSLAKNYEDHELDNIRMAHCIIANNETGIIYTSIMDFLKSV